MALNDNALVTLEQTKKHLGIPELTTAQDGTLEVFINAASAKIERYCDRKFKAEDYVHLFNGDSTGVLIAKEWPVNEVISVVIDTSRDFTNPLKKVPDDSVTISDSKEMIVIDHSMAILRGKRIIQASYTAGYEEIPGDLQLAALLTVEWLYAMRTTGSIGRSNLSKGDENISYESGLPAAVRMLIEDFRRQEFAESFVNPDRF